MAASGCNSFVLGIRNPPTIGITGDVGEFLSISVNNGEIFLNEIRVIDKGLRNKVN